MPIPPPPHHLFVRAVKGATRYLRYKLAVYMPAPPGGEKPPHCPYLGGAIELNTIWFGAVDAMDARSILQEISLFPEQFARLEPATDLVNRAAFLVLPRLADMDRALLENLRVILSMQFYIPRGLLLGSFWLDKEDPDSGEKWVLPMLPVRYIVRGDPPVLNRLQHPQERAAAFAKHASLFPSQA